MCFQQLHRFISSIVWVANALCAKLHHVSEWNLFINSYFGCILLCPHDTLEWLRVWSMCQTLISQSSSYWCVKEIIKNTFSDISTTLAIHGLNCISFLDSISSIIYVGQSHLNHIITFEDFMSYSIYYVLKISWLGICKSWSKYYHPSTRCLWCLKSKDHIHNCDMNQGTS